MAAELGFSSGYLNAAVRPILAKQIADIMFGYLSEDLRPGIPLAPYETNQQVELNILIKK
jgi:hypothetical protein